MEPHSVELLVLIDPNLVPKGPNYTQDIIVLSTNNLYQICNVKLMILFGFEQMSNAAFWLCTTNGLCRVHMRDTDHVRSLQGEGLFCESFNNS